MQLLSRQANVTCGLCMYTGVRYASICACLYLMGQPDLAHALCSLHHGDF